MTFQKVMTTLGSIAFAFALFALGYWLIWGPCSTPECVESQRLKQAQRERIDQSSPGQLDPELQLRSADYRPQHRRSSRSLHREYRRREYERRQYRSRRGHRSRRMRCPQGMKYRPATGSCVKRVRVRRPCGAGTGWKCVRGGRVRKRCVENCY